MTLCEIENRLSKLCPDVSNDMSYDVALTIIANDIERLQKENKFFKEALKEVAEYETCWKCEHYLDGADKYCTKEGLGRDGCDINRSAFMPTERSKRIALKALEKKWD